MKEQGFTIIEVSLFLAISGSLILLTIGLWTMVSRQRFQDTMITLKNTIQSEYEEVRTNINERLGNTDIKECFSKNVETNRAGNSECLVIGKLIQFTRDSQDVRISYIVSEGDKSGDYSGMGDEQALKKMALHVIGGNNTGTSGYYIKTSDPAVIPKDIRIEWGGEFASGWTIPVEVKAPEPSDTIAILHSPISNAVLVFAFKSNPVGSDGKLDLSGSGLINQPVALMIRNNLVGFKGAAICIDSGASSVAVRAAIPADNNYNFDNNTITGKGGSSSNEELNSLEGLCAYE
jgi:type II secretory pathway pseudopilin PulG